MAEVADLLLAVLRQAWLALVGALISFTTLALLAQALRAAAGASLSARTWVWQALSGGAAASVLALFGLLGAPALAQGVGRALPGSGGCGPVTELGSLAAALIAALAALRLLQATFTAVMWASAGGSAPLSEAIVQAAEAIFGMLLATLAAPLAAHFLGAC